MEERNTRICYLYRDADNYKMSNEVVIKGTLTEAEVEEIVSLCEDGEHFIPRQVGLPEKRFESWDDQSDHCWFELSEDGFETTGDPWTEDVTAQELISAFRKAAEEGWDDSCCEPF